EQEPVTAEPSSGTNPIPLPPLPEVVEEPARPRVLGRGGVGRVEVGLPRLQQAVCAGIVGVPKIDPLRQVGNASGSGRTVCAQNLFQDLRRAFFIGPVAFLESGTGALRVSAVGQERLR